MKFCRSPKELWKEAIDKAIDRVSRQTTAWTIEEVAKALGITLEEK